MGLRFRRSWKIAPGLRLNLSKGGFGFSMGGKGVRVGVGPRGAYVSGGIPGTGLYAINYVGKTRGTRSRTSTTDSTTSPTIPIPQALRGGSGCLMMLAMILAIPLLAYATIWGVITLGAVIGWGLYVRSTAKFKAHSHIGEANKALKQGNVLGAAQQFDEAVQVYPSLASLHLLAGNLYQAGEDFEKATPFYEKYRELYQGVDGQAELGLALCYLETGRGQEALALLQALPMEFKQELPVIITIGRVFLELNQPELAVEVLEKGPVRRQQMDDEMMGFRYWLGIAYKRADQPQKAVTQLRKVYAEDMGFLDVSDHLKELNAL